MHTERETLHVLYYMHAVPFVESAVRVRVCCEGHSECTVRPRVCCEGVK